MLHLNSRAWGLGPGAWGLGLDLASQLSVSLGRIETNLRPNYFNHFRLTFTSESNSLGSARGWQRDRQDLPRERKTTD